MFQSGHLSLSHFMAPERTSAIGNGFPEIILFKNLALQFYSTKLNRPCFNVSERPSIRQPFYGTRDREGGVIGIIYLFMTRVWLLSLQNLSLEFHSSKLIVCPCFDVSEWSFMPQPFYGTRNRDWRVPLASFMTREFKEETRVWVSLTATQCSLEKVLTIMI